MRQPNFFSSSAGSGSAVTRPDRSHDDATARSGPPTPINGTRPGQRPPLKAPRRRLWVTILLLGEFLLAITVRIFVGVIVLVLPWSPLWDNNHLLQAFPHLATLLSYGATRGVVSGMGLMNLWIAVDDTLHRSERHN